MSIPVSVSARRIFDDRVDLVARSADGVPVTLRLSRTAAFALAGHLIVAWLGEGDAAVDIPGILDHPETLPTPEPLTPG